MTQFAQVEVVTAQVVGFFIQDTPPADTERFQFHEVNPPLAQIPPPQESPTQVLYWSGRLLWSETAPLEILVARAVGTMDDLADKARSLALIKTTKSLEYSQAQEQAEAWQRDGFIGTAPEDVQSWADARWRDNMTPLDAAQDILLSAVRYKTLLSAIRRLRLKYMEDAKHSTSGDDLKALVDEFTLKLKNTMSAISST